MPWSLSGIDVAAADLLHADEATMGGFGTTSANLRHDKALG